MRLLLAIAVVASIGVGQEAGHAVISGTVVEASTGEPIRKAIVTLTLQGEPKRWATARSNSSGQFTFAGLPAGKYDLSATMQGVGTAWPLLASADAFQLSRARPRMPAEAALLRRGFGGVAGTPNGGLAHGHSRK